MFLPFGGIAIAAWIMFCVFTYTMAPKFVNNISEYVEPVLYYIWCPEKASDNTLSRSTVVLYEYK